MTVYGIRSFYQRNTETRWYETEEEARSEGMKRNGDIFLLEGDGVKGNVIDTLKEMKFEVGQSYTYTECGQDLGGIAKLIAINGKNVTVQLLDGSSKSGRLIGNVLVIDIGTFIYPFNTVRNVSMEIIEAFEDFLQARGIRVPSSDAEMEADGALEGNEALIYGSDYAELEDAISKCFEARR